MKYLWIALLVLAGLVACYLAFAIFVMNPRVEQELREHPDGARARRVMLLTLPSGRAIPVNYLREGQLVYAGADGGWSRELRGPGAPVLLFIRGEALAGHARAVEDDPERRAAVFLRLRPNALKFAGTLVVVELAPRQ